MPPIQSISCDKNELKFVAQKATNLFDISKFPPEKDSVAKAEDYINNFWIPSLRITDYQLEVHVFSLSPLELTVYSANIGEKIQQNWWIINE